MTTVADLEHAGYDTWSSDDSIEIAGWTLHGVGVSASPTGSLPLSQA